MSNARKNKSSKKGQPEVRPIPYPFRGISKGEPYALSSDEHFCREALNARTFDQLSDRGRGGPRSGTIKWHKDPVHSAIHDVQDINSLIPFGTVPAYGTPTDQPRAGDPGGNPGVPEVVPPGMPWVPGLFGDGPWYVNPKRCSDDTLLNIWIEWGLLPMFLNAFQYNGICYYANPFDPLIDDPPAILLPGDPLLGEVRIDSCDNCRPCGNNLVAQTAPAGAIASEPKWIGIDPTDDELQVNNFTDVYGGNPPAAPPEVIIAIWSWAFDIWSMDVRLSNTGRFIASFSISIGPAVWGDPTSTGLPGSASGTYKDITDNITCVNGQLTGTFTLQAVNTASGDWTFTLG